LPKYVISHVLRDAGGLGLGLVSSHALHGHIKEHGVHIVDVEGFPLPSAWHIVHPASKKLSPLALAFKQHLLNEISRRKSKLLNRINP
jgi:DNA-binding transcriptional LysR family regulator